MKLAHFAIVTPGRCGLYETTRELVTALRINGVDSRIIDPTRETNKLHPGGEHDRGAMFGDAEWAQGADYLISHSGLGKFEKGSAQPIIHVAHGRPRSSFIQERDGGPPVYSYHYHKKTDDRFKAVVTFWPEHLPYLASQWGEKPVHWIMAPVDLGAWSPNGPSGYRFNDKGGEINVVSTDAFRSDIDPFAAVSAFIYLAKNWNRPSIKLHIYGGDVTGKGWGALLKPLIDNNQLGETVGWVKGLANVYRAADLMITPHHIQVRSVREAMACGCPVVKVDEHCLGESANQIQAAISLDRAAVRLEAERRFDPKVSALMFERMIKEL